MNNLAFCILFKDQDVKWEKLKVKNYSLKLNKKVSKKKRDLSFYGTFFLSKLLIKSFLINYL